jgi:hypothetical protein
VTRPQSLAKAAELKKSTIQIPSTTTSSVDKYPRYRLDRAASVKMKLNISYPANGSQKIIEVDDERKLRPFMEKRMGTEVSTPHPIPRLDDQLEKGYTHDGEQQANWDLFSNRLPAMLLVMSSRVTSSRLPVVTTSRVRNLSLVSRIGLFETG